MNESVTWIVVADSARAHIYSAEKSSPKLRIVSELSHPESRMHSKDLMNDRPGRIFERVGGVQHAMTTATNPKEIEKVRFCAELADRLEAARKHNKMGKLIIIAEPAFLGELRGRLSQPTSRLVSLEIAKNLTSVRPDQLQEHLPLDWFDRP